MLALASLKKTEDEEVVDAEVPVDVESQEEGADEAE